MTIWFKGNNIPQPCQDNINYQLANLTPLENISILFDKESPERIEYFAPNLWTLTDLETDSISEGGRVNLVYEQAMSNIKPELPSDSDTETGIIDDTVTRVQNDDDELPSSCKDESSSQLIAGNSDCSPSKAPGEREICGKGKNKGKKGYCTKDAKHKGTCNSEGYYSKFYEFSESGIASIMR